MAKLSILAGSTSQTVNVFIQDSSATTGAGLTGLVFNTSSLTCYYVLPKAASAVVSLATLAAATSAWSSGGFKEIDATNCPGLYRLDLPDAALASGRFVTVYLRGATNMAQTILEIELTAVNNQDGVHGGMSALPNTACTTNASLLTSGTGTDQLSVSSGLTNITQAAADKAWSTAARVLTAGTNIQLPSNGLANVTTWTVAITGNITGNLSGSVGSVTGAVGSVTGAVASVTGNVGGNVTGSVGSVVGAVGSVTGAVGSVTGAVGSVTGNVGGNVVGTVASVVGAVGSVTGLTASNLDATVSSRLATSGYTAPPTAAQNATAVLTTQMTESYATLHTVPTLAQIMFEMRGLQAEKGVAVTTLTIKKIDGSTSAETFTLNDATVPTAITRAS